MELRSSSWTDTLMIIRPKSYIIILMPPTGDDRIGTLIDSRRNVFRVQFPNIPVQWKPECLAFHQISTEFPLSHVLSKMGYKNLTLEGKLVFKNYRTFYTKLPEQLRSKITWQRKVATLAL